MTLVDGDLVEIVDVHTQRQWHLILWHDEGDHNMDLLQGMLLDDRRKKGMMVDTQGVVIDNTHTLHDSWVAAAVLVTTTNHASCRHDLKMLRTEHEYPVPNSSVSHQPYSIYSWDLDLDHQRYCHYCSDVHVHPNLQ